MQAFVNTEGPKIEYAIKQLKKKKSPGSDEVYPEVLKLISENNIDIFVDVFNRIYKTGRMPGEWLESIIIPIQLNQPCSEGPP